jgi:hypothetical protein
MADRRPDAGAMTDAQLLARVWDWAGQADEPIDAPAIAQAAATPTPFYRSIALRVSTKGVPALATRRPGLVWFLLLAPVSLALLAGVGAILSAGAREQRLPPPLGPARNGIIVTVDRSETLTGIDPETGDTWSLGQTGWPMGFSNDGRRLLFQLPMTGRHLVMNADGSGVRGLPSEGVDSAWAPDGDRVAIVRDVGPLSIDDVESGTSIQYNLGIDLGIDPDVQWRPNHDEINVQAGAGANVGSYLVNADGTGLRRVGPASEVAYGVWSPDGSTIAYTHSSPRIHLLDVDTGADRELTFDGSEGTAEFAQAYSPDGSRLLITRLTDDPRCDKVDPQWGCVSWALVVVPAVGGGPAVLLGSDDHIGVGGGPGGGAIWSPDGTKILAFFGELPDPELRTRGGTWLFDPDTGQAEQVSWWPSDTDWMTWQRLAP